MNLNAIWATVVDAASRLPIVFPSVPEGPIMKSMTIAMSSVVANRIEPVPTPTSPAWYLRRKMTSRISSNAKIVAKRRRILATPLPVSSSRKLLPSAYSSVSPQTVS